MEPSSNQTAPHPYHLDQNNLTNATLSNSSFDAALDQAFEVTCIILLIDTMFSLGCMMEVSKIKEHIKKPKGVVFPLVVQFGVMPLTAFCLAKLFQLSTGAAFAVLVCGCSPGGMISNVLSFAAKGDLNLSIVMTTFSTLAALGMIPLLLFIYCHGFSDLTAVPYLGIIITLILTVLPCTIGIYISYRFPEKSKLLIKVGPIGFTVFGILLSISVESFIWAVTGPGIVATGALMPLIGYLLGYVLPFFFKFDEACRRTIAMETGCQNLQLCFTILEVAFDKEVIGPFVFFPVVFFFFQIIEALILIVIFRYCKTSSCKPASRNHTITT